MATEEVGMSGKRYTYAFKIEAVKQVTERGVIRWRMWRSGWASRPTAFTPGN